MRRSFYIERSSRRVGNKYGRLTYVEALPNNMGLFKCDCGEVINKDRRQVYSLKVRSCGCLRRELRSTNGGRSLKPEYDIWRNMIDRCFNCLSDAYKHYGGRGITVCEEWKNSFDSFLEYIGERPSNKYSIDRINNDGNYEPGNVRWATDLEQGRNRSVNHWVEYNGESLIIREWTKRYHVGTGQLTKLLRRGTPEEVFAFLAQPIEPDTGFRKIKYFRDFKKKKTK